MKQFILNQNSNLKESQCVEFKKIPTNTDGIAYIKKVIPKYMSAFLNTTDVDGGSIFFGILDNGYIEGFSFNQKEHQNEDRLKLMIDDIARNKISPSVAPHFYTVEIHPIYNENRQLTPNLHIIEIKVSRDKHTIYFYDGNKIVAKTHSQVRVFSGSELVEFIKRRKKIIDSKKPINNLYDLVKTLDLIKPILYWSNQDIPYINSKKYIEALQNFFYSRNELTKELDYNLLKGLDNLLRIGYAYPKIDGYIYEKFNVVEECFYNYIKLINDLHKYDDIITKFHYLRGDLSYFLSTHQDNLKYEDTLLINLAIKTLEYYRVQKQFNKPNTLFKKPLTKIPIEINQTIIKLLIPLIEDNLSVSCDDNIEYIKDLCRYDWQNFIK